MIHSIGFNNFRIITCIKANLNLILIANGSQKNCLALRWIFLKIGSWLWIMWSRRRLQLTTSERAPTNHVCYFFSFRPSSFHYTVLFSFFKIFINDLINKWTLFSSKNFNFFCIIKEISEKKLVVCSSIKNVVTGLVRKEADIVETVRLKIFL